jgi:putative heme iron utilization protein
MNAEDQARLKELLCGQRLLALGVAVDAVPVVGLVPYAVTADCTALLIQASRLAHHSQGLKAGGRWSGVVHEPDRPETDPLQVARLTVEGTVVPLAGGDADFDAGARTFLKRFAGASMTLSLPDFTLYRLELDGGRLILGFGRALNLSKSSFADLAAPAGS